MDAPYGHAARILELAEQLRELADKIERETAASIVETRTHGVMCGRYEYEANRPEVADIVWDGSAEEGEDTIVKTHKMEPLDNASLHDEPPSKPL
jgi:hypothetical protein